MKKTLVILSAGIGSRFGGGIKQLEPVDDNGHIIIDYSIHDAIEAGFNKIVFIIRHDIEEDFKNVIGDRIEKICTPLGVEIAYAFQELSDVPIQVDGRTKPWGTGHAVLSAADQIDSSFAVINADDYYGKKGFKKAADFLETDNYGLVGYVLKNTLSDNGGVTRGICKVSDGTLIGIEETKNIIKTKTGAEADGRIIDINSLVSMNFWCYPTSFLDILKNGFPSFQESMNDPLKDEYLLPIIADKMLREGYSFSVLPTDDQWFGVTYKEDKPAVVESFKELIEKGIYTNELF
ncbi:MAG: nucleotidyltransferase [Eubacterium sp.]|nr:nucleotidyltransferase [Eubacterium sp.]